MDNPQITDRLIWVLVLVTWFCEFRLISLVAGLFRRQNSIVDGLVLYLVKFHSARYFPLYLGFNLS